MFRVQSYYFILKYGNTMRFLIIFYPSNPTTVLFFLFFLCLSRQKSLFLPKINHHGIYI